MTCPGNHEWHYNFSNYKARFNMPGDHDNNTRRNWHGLQVGEEDEDEEYNA